MERDLELRPVGAVLKGRSPKNRDTEPSFVVWPGSQCWRDYSGGGSEGGDVFDYVQYSRGLSFIETLRTLASEAGIAVPGVTAEQAAADLQTLHARRRIEALLTEAASYYHWVLPTKLRREVYQRRYGYTDATIDDLKLGFGWSGLNEHLTGRFGATREEALSTGLFVLVQGGIVDFFWGRLVFPYWRGGRVVYLIGRRSLLSSDAAWDKPKYRKLPCHSDKRPYISPLIANDFFFGEDDAHMDGDLVICEGIANAISARQSGFACISPVTTAFRTQDHDKLLRLTLRAKRVIIANDSEHSGAGEKGALETARMLHAAGRDVRIATIPRPAGVEKIDVNDLVREQAPEALKAVLADALRLPAFLLGSIPTTTQASDLTAALEPVFEALQSAEPLERSQALDQIAKRFSVGKRPLAEQYERFAQARARSSARDDRSQSGLPAIVINKRQQRDFITEATSAVASSNVGRIAAAVGQLPGPGDVPPVFVRGGRVVGLGSEHEQPRLVDLNETAMYGVLLRVTDWFSAHEGESGGDILAHATPPADVPRDLLAFPPRDLQPLDAVVTTPVFARDGSLVTAAGYHAGERLWLHAAPRLGTIDVPAAPSLDEVAEARRLFVAELLCDFPFVDDGDRAHAVAALLLPFARRLIGGCTPLHVIEAPTAGSGKGMLANLTSIVATGQVCDARSLSAVEEDCRKMLTAKLSSGRPLILLDNISEKRVLDSSPLAAALTAAQIHLGLSGVSRFPGDCVSSRT